MKTKIISSLIALSLVGVSSAATTFTENFDASTSLPAGWSSVGDASIDNNISFSLSGTNSLKIGTRNTINVTTPILGLAGATTATISFQWTTDIHSSSPGRIPRIQYSSDGSSFTEIGSITIPSDTTSIPAHMLFSATITDAAHVFTANSAFRIVGSHNGGGSGAYLYVDNFSVTSNAIPEPSIALLGGIGFLLLLRRRRA